MEVDLPPHVSKALLSGQLKRAEDVVVLTASTIQRKTALNKDDAVLALTLCCNHTYNLMQMGRTVLSMYQPDVVWQHYQSYTEISQKTHRLQTKREYPSPTTYEGPLPAAKREKIFPQTHTGIHNPTNLQIPSSRPDEFPAQTQIISQGVEGTDLDIPSRAVPLLINQSRQKVKTIDECKRRLTLGCPVLDSYFRGGLLVPSITEISGDSATGKTQWALQMCLTCQLPTEVGGLDGCALYICTEAKFPARRLITLAQYAADRFKMQPGHEWLKRVFVERAHDLTTLLTTITTLLPKRIELQKIKLIVIDSVTAVFRGEYGAGQEVNRGDDLYTLANALSQVASKYGVAVVVVNQVSALIDDNNGTSGQTTSESNCQSTPALGLLWANLINQRIVLSRRDRGTLSLLPVLPLYNSLINTHMGTHDAPNDIVLRDAQVIFAPHLPLARAPYYVIHQGIYGYVP